MNTPKHIDALPFDTVTFDLAITVCDNAATECPSLPQRARGQTKIIHRSFDDPPGLTRDMTDDAEKLRVYQRVANEIREFVLTLPSLLAP